MKNLLRRAAGLGLVALGLPFLASCQQAAQRSMPCPMVQVLPDASYLTRFAGESEDLTDTAFEARIGIANQLCHYQVNNDTGKTTIATDLSLRIEASRGPKLTGDKADLRYYVSVTGPSGSHMGDPKWRNTFDVSIPLTADKPTNGVIDQPSITIPLKKDESGDFYRIYVYFDVTEKELAYNRRNPKQ
jgi:hypothetical protein